MKKKVGKLARKVQEKIRWKQKTKPENRLFVKGLEYNKLKLLKNLLKKNTNEIRETLSSRKNLNNFVKNELKNKEKYRYLFAERKRLEKAIGKGGGWVGSTNALLVSSVMALTNFADAPLREKATGVLLSTIGGEVAGRVVGKGIGKAYAKTKEKSALKTVKRKIKKLEDKDILSLKRRLDKFAKKEKKKLGNLERHKARTNIALGYSSEIRNLLKKITGKKKVKLLKWPKMVTIQGFIKKNLEKQTLDGRLGKFRANDKVITTISYDIMTHLQKSIEKKIEKPVSKKLFVLYTNMNKQLENEKKKIRENQGDKLLKLKY